MLVPPSGVQEQTLAVCREQGECLKLQLKAPAEGPSLSVLTLQGLVPRHRGGYWEGAPGP